MIIERDGKKFFRFKADGPNGLMFIETAAFSSSEPKASEEKKKAHGFFIPSHGTHTHKPALDSRVFPITLSQRKRL